MPKRSFEMNSEVEDLFDAARRLNDPARRRAFLDAACHDHPELQRNWSNSSPYSLMPRHCSIEESPVFIPRRLICTH